MTVNPAKGSELLSIDSVEVLTPERYFTLHDPGLYFFQADSTTTQGTSIVVTDQSFPQPMEISDLTEPLIYITTRNENQKLKENLSDKQALDKFWLSTVGSADLARSAIKNFYQNVEDANALFTSYKEGWKTDRGMIYTVMGPPISMTKEADSETWIYQSAGSEDLRFVFKKISNIFSNNHYELFRDKSYDRPWFLAIDRWRKGQTR
jgi:GWxTD domain-containing protein